MRKTNSLVSRMLRVVEKCWCPQHNDKVVCALRFWLIQLLHGMESTTNAMLAQFVAGLMHFTDYKRCKVLGDLLGVDDVTQPPLLDHHSALFLFRLLAELRSVSCF